MIGEHESVQQVSKDYKNVDQNQIHMQRYACEGEQARTLHLVSAYTNLRFPSEIFRFGMSRGATHLGHLVPMNVIRLASKLAPDSIIDPICRIKKG